MSETEKILDKLKKIKAHAESAEKIGNEEEAHAFAAMLQKLLLKYKLSITEVQEAEVKNDEKIEKHWIDWKANGVEPRSNRVKWTEILSSIVAEAYFCRILVKYGSNAICLVGRTSDVAVAEYVIATLVRSAEKISWREYNNRARHASRNGYKMEKGFRASFLDGFISRLKQRLKEELHQEAPVGSNALVRVNRALAEVDDFMNQMRGIGKARNLRSRRTKSIEGLNAGRNFANSVDIKGQAMKAGRTTKSRQLGSGS